MAASNTYAQMGNLEYIESLYQQFQKNPNSVSADWKRFFEGVEFGQDGGLGLSEKELDVYQLIKAYRDYGHFEADLDPLTNTPSPSDQLSLSRFRLSEADLEKTFQIGQTIGKPQATLREIIAHMRACYCGKLTVQCAEALPDVRSWFIKEFEQNKTNFKLTPQEKKDAFHSLTRAESLEKFIHTRYVGTKRFSIEGGDALMPMLETLVSRGTGKQVEEILVGMAHRGRVNVLANFMGKALEYIFADFNGPTETSEPIDDFGGDVKYHLGYKSDKKTDNGDCQVTLAFNPSHLEAVNPVVLGMARAGQRRRKDTQNRKKVIPVLIHGDAAFAGQGVVAETFQMSQVKGYTVGGTIHLSIDNQIGFTTSPENGRSSHYCSDVSKVIATPVLHVNGDDIESCIRAMDIALRFRQEWGRDVVVNVICYRRYGHNEGDEPAYTQPLMYELIKKHPTPREIYGKQLIREGVIDQKYFDSLFDEKMENLQKIYEHTKANPPKIQPVKFDGFWTGLRKAKAQDFEKPTDTTIDIEVLKKIGQQLGSVPSGFTPHPKLVKLLQTRTDMAKGKDPLDWGMAELLSYGSLLHDGTSVRLTGQDCVRGTFTHRHAGLYDFKTGESYVALDHVNDQTVEFCVYDSILSEYGVMGFEYGNAISDPTFLTLWEAQFGDFVNGAQIIIDQFLSAGEAKWQQMSGLVLLLPHGYEGQGPEHSSARLERFLQLCAQYNMQVCNLTTPAQIFHALRRQMKRPFRKPLIVMSPKSLLRHPRAVSTIQELAEGTFQEIIPDLGITDPKKVETVAFCSGKIYYDLLEEREKQKNQRTALVRMEQIYPTPTAQIIQVLKSYPKLKNVIWVQEEPKNMGSWGHVFFRFQEIIAQEKLKLNFEYVGRPDRASPATGSIYRHKVEQAEIVENCFKI
ncbi:MAG: 2-oxoglutarate dehydrogenase subunit E1 [Bdellovibrio sp. CG10_big_fil_rev_8_21_14_0_10_47_8]|nr:MAG: 2-oxoglutarate dehydrogenase subunit E1 [Bdellovibrio sp. CG10_big_fil_rev_8_21_14_0_10_47_8]